MHSLLAQPHHDGSEAYVPETPPELGDDVTVLLRVPKPSVGRTPSRFATCATGIRSLRGRRSITRPTHDVWWRATFPVATSRPRIAGSCRAVTSATPGSTRMGLHEFDVPDADDFVVSPGAGGPDWHLESVVYQVFPDRFASSGRDGHAARTGRSREAGTSSRPGAVPRRPWSGSAAIFAGIEERLDHLTSLGVNVLYLTPVFPAQSTHRYDATTFDSVDPLLGGDGRLCLPRARGAFEGDQGARRPDDEPRGLGARVVRRRTGATGARARVLLLRRRLRARVCLLVRRAVAPEARLRERGAARADVPGFVLGRAPLARAAVRPRRLAYRRREHDRPTRRRRRPPRRRARRETGSRGGAVRRPRRRGARARRSRRSPPGCAGTAR